PELHSTQSGGTPYGASSVGHEPSLTAEETRLAQQLGKRLATAALKLKACH
ncbi:transcriptional regulator, partial [Vibrio parahaemolyticus]